MEGKKKLVNRTDADLSVQLTVRRGSNPENTLKRVNVSLGADGSKMVHYGSEENPYLNGIALNAVKDGETVAEQEFTFERGNEVDDDLNVHDTVVIEFDSDGGFVLHYENTWTV